MNSAARSSTMECTLRLAAPKDAAAMLAIYAPYIADTTITLEAEVLTTVEFAERVRKLEGLLPWLVATNEGQVIGYAYAIRHRERSAYQWSVEASVYVQAAYHGIGVARQLYTRLFDLLRQQGYVNVYAGVVQPNSPSESFHLALGFEPVGTYQHVGYKFGKWHDVLWLAKQLQPPPAAPAPPIPLAAL